jgi:hypothetical protein
MLLIGEGRGLVICFVLVRLGYEWKWDSCVVCGFASNGTCMGMKLRGKKAIPFILESRLREPFQFLAAVSVD